MRATPRPQTPGPRPLLVFAGAALVALVLYLPTLQYDFVWDDSVLIQKNSFLDQTNPIELFTRVLQTTTRTRSETRGDMAYYRPLTNLSFYLERKLWGLRPMGYHLTNVIINAAVVFMMCLEFFLLSGKRLFQVFQSWLARAGRPAGQDSSGDELCRHFHLEPHLPAGDGLPAGELLRVASGRQIDARVQGTKEPRNQAKSPEPPNPRPPESDSRLWRKYCLPVRSC